MGYVFINWGINLDIIIFPTRLITILKFENKNQILLNYLDFNLYIKKCQEKLFDNIRHIFLHTSDIPNFFMLIILLDLINNLCYICIGFIY